MIPNENGKLIDGRETVNIIVERGEIACRSSYDIFRESKTFFEHYGNIKNPVYFVNGLRIPDEVRRNYLNDDEKLDSLFHKSIKLLEKKLELINEN